MTPPSLPGEEEHHNLGLRLSRMSRYDLTLQLRGEEKNLRSGILRRVSLLRIEIKIGQIVKSNFQSDLEKLLLKRSYFTSI